MNDSPPYLEVHQVIEFIRDIADTTKNADVLSSEGPRGTLGAPGHTMIDTSLSTRAEMQVKRIAQGLSVQLLASKVRCDVESLAAYEQGEGTLDPQTISQINLVLEESCNKKRRK